MSDTWGDDDPIVVPAGKPNGAAADDWGANDPIVSAARPAEKTWTDRGKEFTSGINAAIADTLGAPVDLMSGAMNVPTRVQNFVVRSLGVGKELPLPYPEDSAPFGGSASIKRAMGAAGIDPDATQPTDTAGRVLKGSGYGVGAMVAPEAVVGALGRAGALTGQALEGAQRVFGGAQSAPQLAADAAVGAAAGATGKAAAEITPEPYKPLAEMAGNLVGGAGVAAVTAIPRAVGKGVQAAKEYAAPLSEAGRERIAARRLEQSATDPAAVRAALEEPKPDLVPGSKPTTFQETGDLGLGALERSVAASDPAPFQQRRAEQNAARVRALDDLQPEGSPVAVAESFRRQLAEIERAGDMELEAARLRAQQATEALGGARGAEEYAATARQALEESRAAMKAQENQLWRAVDPDGTLHVITSPLRQAVREIYTGISPERAGGVTARERAFADLISEYGPTLPFNRLQDLRSEISAAMREARSPMQPNELAYGRLTELRGAVEKAIDETVARRAAEDQAAVAAGKMAPEQTMAASLQRDIDAWRERKTRAEAGEGVGEGTPSAGALGEAAVPAAHRGEVPAGAGRTTPRDNAPGDRGVPGDVPGGPTLADAEVAARLRQASDATRERKEAFGDRIIAPLLKRPTSTAPYDLMDSAVVSRIFPAGDKGAEAIRAFERAVKGSAEAMAAIEAVAAATLRREAMLADGTIDPRKFTAWQKKHASALNAIPAEVQAGFRNAAVAGATVERVAAARKDAVATFQKSEAGRLLGLQDGADVVTSVGSILRAKDAVKRMRELAAAAKKDPVAEAGLRRAVAEHIETTFISNTEVGTSGVPALKADAFQRFVKEKAAALAQVMTPGQMEAMRAIAADLQRANRSITSVKLPGGSNTAQDVLGAAKKTSIFGQLTKAAVATKMAMGAGAGGLTFGPLGAWAGAGGGIGAQFLSGMRQAGMRGVDDLVREALLDPALARALLAKAPPKPDTGSWRTVTARLRKLAVLAPAQAAAED